MSDLQNIFLIGPLGAGKSSVGRQLARVLHMDFYDTDRLVEERAGVDLAWIFDLEGEEGFRRRELAVLKEVTQYFNIVLATGGGTILNEASRKLLKEKGRTVYLSTNLKQQYSRTRFNKYNRPLLRDVNVEERLRWFAKEREPLYRDISEKEFITDNKSVKVVANEILQFLTKE